jgi:hypothetical protein
MSRLRRDWTSNNSLQTGNTQQREGHSAAAIQLSNIWVLEAAKLLSPVSGFQTLPEAPTLTLVGAFLRRCPPPCTVKAIEGRL